MPEIRAFIAIELPSEIKSILSNVQSQLKKVGSNTVKWVDPVNIHLTLKFLGDISTAQIDPVHSALQSAAQTAHPFRLAVQSAGAFPGLNRVQVIWIGLQGELETLTNLQRALDAQLSQLGFSPEKRPFSPHLTIGRVRETATLIERQNIAQSLSQLKLQTGVSFGVNSINLMQSRLLPAGPIYTCLKSVKFS
jgi:RNA 2',3'-cyclic 3'-phosphodiesterase